MNQIDFARSFLFIFFFLSPKIIDKRSSASINFLLFPIDRPKTIFEKEL